MATKKPTAVKKSPVKKTPAKAKVEVKAKAKTNTKPKIKTVTTAVSASASASKSVAAKKKVKPLLTPQSTSVKKSVSKKTAQSINLHSLLLESSKAPVIKKLNISATMASAIALHEKGEHRQAYLTCELIVRADPRHAGAFHLMGMIAAETQNFPLAMAWMTQSLLIDPQNYTAHNNLGVVQSVLKDLPAAQASFQKAIALKSDYPEALNNLGVVLRDVKQVQEALTCFQKALRLKPDYVDAKSNETALFKRLQSKQSLQ